MWRRLWLISGFWWDLGRMLIPTIDLVTLSDIWTTTIQVRLVYHNASLHKTLCVHKVLQTNLRKTLNW
jgi:hypothetical protein